MLGKKFSGSKGTLLTVIAEVDSPSKCHRRFLVEFDSGFQTAAYAHQIKNGRVRDWGAETTQHGGNGASPYPGFLKSKVGRRAKRLWDSMWARASSPTGAYANVSVCEEWRSFAAFWRDIQLVPGFNRWAAGQALHLDKDGLSGPSKVYSRNTVQFIQAKENAQIGLRRPIYLDGACYLSIGHAARQLGKSECCVSYWFNKKRASDKHVSASLLPWHPFLTGSQ